jgi:hypothetical protein
LDPGQVLLDEDEIAEIHAAARRRHPTVSEYVRTTLREARLGEPGLDTAGSTGMPPRARMALRSL